MRNGVLTSLIMTGLLFAAGAVADDDDHDEDRDWRKQASLERKVEKLIEALPSTATIMIEVGERYQDLYWAARLGKWAFAEYQLEEIESLIELLQITRPGRAATAQVFLDEGLGGFAAAFEKQDPEAFNRAFGKLRTQCMDCHVANDHAFIELPEQPVTASSVILNLPRQ